MVYGVVYSMKDPAGRGVARKLVEIMHPRECSVCRDAVECFCGGNYVIAGFNEDVIYFDFLDRVIDVDKYIVLSRHSSQAKVKSYTVHHTGNPGPQALYGGKPRRLAIASPATSYTLLRRLRVEAEKRGMLRVYEVSYEATHHGPTEVSKPLCFIEIGSTSEEWNQELNHIILAETVRYVLRNGEEECIPVVGIGGGHYPRKHSRIAFETKYCYGHIFAKYTLDHLDEEMLKQAVERSEPKPQGFIVEKKSTRREHRELIERFAGENNLFVKYI